jgi:hypothetical protein
MDRSQPRIAVNLCRPRFPIKTASVVPSHKVSCLQKLFPDDPKVFIHHGQVLSTALTFAFYGVENGASIVVIPTTEAESPELGRDVRAWLAITRDSDSFNERVRYCLNPSTRQELSRLRDLKYVALERRPRAFMRLVMTIPSFENDLLRNPCHVANTNMEPLNEPNTEPLPLLWVKDKAGQVIVPGSTNDLSDHTGKFADFGVSAD